jgi:hypothetical protein
MYRVLALGLLLTGCDVVFGLDEITPHDATMCPTDRDCDGVLDSIDNCIDVANSDQRDFERDGIGDVCDPCVAEAPSAKLDQDQDGVMDDADLCPAITDPGQEDADGDGVGDACDPDPATRDSLRCYLDFENQALAITAWMLDQNMWSSASSVIVHMDGQPPDSAVLEVSGLLPDLRRFAVSTNGYAQDQTLRPAEYGVGLGGTATALGTRCVLMATGSTFNETVAILGPDGAVLASQVRSPDITNPRIFLQLVAERGADGTTVTCSVQAGTTSPIVVTATAPALTGTVSVSLVARQLAASFNDLTIHQLGS